MELQTALQLVKKYIKVSSAIDGMPHIDLTLVESDERPQVKIALAALKLYVVRGDLTEAQLKQELGLKL